MYTIPWDGGLIKANVWSFESDAVLGPTINAIPIEEVFFFFIQTYITSLLYLLLSRHIVPSVYCESTKGSGSRNLHWRKIRLSGQAVLSTATLLGALGVWYGGKPLYLSLILVWASPVLLFIWTLSYQLLCSLPKSATILPIAAPTLFLWIVDTLALKKGTWTITEQTKTGFFLWKHLEFEEAFFFLMTNCLVVFGQVAFDAALASLSINSVKYFQNSQNQLPSPVDLFKTLMIPLSEYDQEQIDIHQDAVKRLQKKSRSFYMASVAFHGPLRLNLVLLYSFCRTADDLVDEAGSYEEGLKHIEHLHKYLDFAFNDPGNEKQVKLLENFPSQIQNGMKGVPTAALHESKYLSMLIDGLEDDLMFEGGSGDKTTKQKSKSAKKPWPIAEEKDLLTYADLVAGTVAACCISLACPAQKDLYYSLVEDGMKMGQALQLLNIARDVAVDAKMGRVYLPTSWLSEEAITPEDVISEPRSEAVRKVRMRVISNAFDLYKISKPAMDQLPRSASMGLKVAVENYMEIGRVMWENGCVDLRLDAKGRATVPLTRRLRTTWMAMWS